jgi:hypothetical protein
MDAGPFAAKPSCDAGSYCACLGVPSCQCTDDDSGAIVLACHTCYGAPPARLERFALVG